MNNSAIIDGYVITHPHYPYEDAVSIHVNQFATGDDPWQAQIYVDGALVEAGYFPTEADALRYAAREVTLIACAARVGVEAYD